MSCHLLTVLLSWGLGAICVIPLGVAEECLKNGDIGRRSGNVYECTHPEYPRCCEVDNSFTCCQSDTDTVVRDQLTIWGVILVFVVIILVVVFCFRKDIYCFESDTLKQSLRSVFSFSRRRKYRDSEDKDILVRARKMNGIANLGEPDAEGYVRNYLMSETCGVHFTQK